MRRSDYEFLLYERAAAAVPANEDNRRRELAIVEEIARIMAFDVNAEKFRAAKQIVNRLTKTDGMDLEAEPDVGQLVLMIDGKPIDYDPRRLIRDGMGNLVEERDAQEDVLGAELERIGTNIDRVNGARQRKILKYTEFKKWAAIQRAGGRLEREITVGNWTTETGIIHLRSAA